MNDINYKYLYHNIIANPVIEIYWFFTTLFIIYLCLPLFAAIRKEKRKLVFSYLAIVGFVLNSLIPLLKNIVYKNTDFPYELPVVSGFLIYPVLGWLLNNCELKKRHKIIIYTLSAIGLLTHICGTYFLSINAGEIITTFKGYTNVPCILYSTGVFLFLKDIGMKMKNPKCLQIVNFLNRYTFPIYLMQFFPLSVFPKIPIVNTYSIIYRLGAPFVMIPLMIIVTWCMRKIPIIRNIVP